MTFATRISNFVPGITISTDLAQVAPRAHPWFWASKRAFDIFFALFLLPVAIMLGLALLVANPFANKGPLFFRQVRMGRDCKPFWTLKFRTMRKSLIQRGPDDPIEVERITGLGQTLRRARLDELPQIWNVLKGEMSMIGPRPDFFPHAKHYLRSIPEYRARHMVRPGISGLAQVELGYAEGISATRKKALADLHYIQRAGFRLDLWITWRTIMTVLFFRGA